jgi:hypothetical protein
VEVVGVGVLEGHGHEAHDTPMVLTFAEGEKRTGTPSPLHDDDSYKRRSKWIRILGSDLLYLEHLQRFKT